MCKNQRAINLQAVLGQIWKRSNYARKYQRIENAIETNLRADVKEFILHPPPLLPEEAHGSTQSH